MVYRICIIFLVLALIQLPNVSAQESTPTKKLPSLNEMLQKLEQESLSKKDDGNKPIVLKQESNPPEKKQFKNYAELVKNVSEAVVTVFIAKEKDGIPITYGTGFFISPERIITNYHVIESDITTEYKPLKATIEKKNGATYKVKGVLAYDKYNDVAMLEVEEKGINQVYVPLAKTEPEVGEEIVVIGTPTELRQTVTTGIISARRGDMRATNSNRVDLNFLSNRLQISAPITHGSSGSPVFNMSGEVVGVAVGGLNSRDATEINLQNYNAAVPVVYIATLLPMELRTIGEVNRKESLIQIQLTELQLEELIKKIIQFQSLLQQGKCDIAFELLKKIKFVYDEVRLSDAYSQIAVCYYGNKDIESAKKALDSSIYYHEDAYNLTKLASILHYKNQNDKAIDMLEKAILLDPNYTIAVSLLCQIHSERGTTSKYCPDQKIAKRGNEPRRSNRAVETTQDSDTDTDAAPSTPKSKPQPVQTQREVALNQPVKTVQTPQSQPKAQQSQSIIQPSQPIAQPVQSNRNQQSGSKPVTTSTRTTPQFTTPDKAPTDPIGVDTSDARTIEEIYQSAVRLKNLGRITDAHREYVLLKTKDEYLACRLYFVVLYPKRDKKTGNDFYPCEDPVAVKTYFREENAPLPSGLYSK